MHRRRRAARLGSLWPRSGFKRLLSFGPGGLPTPTEVEATAVPKAKVRKALDTGSDCCPVVRVKCHTKKEPQFYKGSDEITGYKRMKYCEVHLGTKSLGLKQAGEAKEEVAMARALLTQNGCLVRVEGNKLGGARKRTTKARNKVTKVVKRAKASKRGKGKR